jgi:hypothetical protein
MKFLLVNEASGFHHIIADGAIGLGLSHLNDTTSSEKSSEKTESHNNFIYQLYSQGYIKQPKFSLYLSSKAAFDSKLFIGDFSQGTILSSIYKQMNYCQVSKKTSEWTCETDGIKVNNKKVPLESFITFDSGRPHTKIPVTDYKIVKKYLIDETNSNCILGEEDHIECECKNPQDFPDLHITFGINQFIIKTSELIDYQPNSKYQCRFEIRIDKENYDTWVLGTSAMRNTLWSFDINSRKIGFVQNPKDINNIISRNDIIISSSDESDTKLGYLFALIFIIIILFAVIKCANGEGFMGMRSSSFNFSNHEDKQKMELIKNKFNTDEYDYDELKTIKKSPEKPEEKIISLSQEGKDRNINLI